MIQKIQYNTLRQADDETQLPDAPRNGGVAYGKLRFWQRGVHWLIIARSQAIVIMAATTLLRASLYNR